MNYMEDPMKPGITDRRRNRSENVQDALAYQLAASARRAKFSAMVLADEYGLIIANTGSKAVCEQMAAVSPLLARNMKPWHGKVKTNKGKVRLSVAPIRVDNMRLYLTASEGREARISGELFTSGKGVSRIFG